MKSKRLTYMIGEGPRELDINVIDKTVALSNPEDNTQHYHMSLDEFFDLAALAHDMRRAIPQAAPPAPEPKAAVMPEPAVRPAPPSTHAPEPLPDNQPGKDRRQAAMDASFMTNQEAKDLASKDMYVICRDGRYFRASNNAGQINEPDQPIERASLIQDAMQAQAIASTFPGAGIRYFGEVANYRIALAWPDNTIKFWAGPGKTTDHVNGSQTITGRAAALLTLQTVQPPMGARAFLLPDIQ
jgi:hypothetical protein